MKNKYEVNYRSLKMVCDPNWFDFETTENLELMLKEKVIIYI